MWSLSTLYIKVQLSPLSKHITSLLQRQARSIATEIVCACWGNHTEPEIQSVNRKRVPSLRAAVYVVTIVLWRVNKQELLYSDIY